MAREKNKMTRAASILLVLVLMTTSFLSGVLAKYVITDNGTDMARVAKFGVVTTVEGSLFGDSYAATTDDSIQAWAVNGPTVSADTKGTDVVAPGTKNDKGMTISVTGTPEVSTRIIFDAPENGSNADYANSDIYLKNGDYSIMAAIAVADATITSDNMGDYYTYDSSAKTFAVISDASDIPSTGNVYKRINMTNANGIGVMTAGHASTADANWNASNDYYPITWKIDGTAISTAANNNVAGVLTTIGSGLNMSAGTGTLAGKYVAEAVPNTNLGTSIGSKKVTWAWDFSTASGDSWQDIATGGNWENTTIEDACDTLLGEMIAQAATSGGLSTYKIAKAGNSTLDEVLYANVPVVSGSANNAYVAYTGSTVPSVVADADVACLTVSFGARVTVEQID